MRSPWRCCCSSAADCCCAVWQLNRVNPGFDERNALAVTLQLPEKKYASPEQIARLSEQLVQQVSSLPGVEATGIARILPIVHDLPTGFYFAGYARPKDNELPQTNYSAVSPGYFKAMGIPLVAGRAFTSTTRTTRRASRSSAKRWPNVISRMGMPSANEST